MDVLFHPMQYSSVSWCHMQWWASCVTAASLSALLTGCTFDDDVASAGMEPHLMAVAHREKSHKAIDRSRSIRNDGDTPPASPASRAASAHPLPRPGKGYKTLRDRMNQPASPKLVNFLAKQRIALRVAQEDVNKRVMAWKRSRNPLDKNYRRELAAFLKTQVDSYYGIAIQAKMTERIKSWRREQIEGFSSADLLAAAREAGRLSLQEGAVLTDPIDQLGRTGGAIQLCLQNYPLKVNGDEGIEPLLTVIRDSSDEWHLRHYLISCIEFAGPGGVWGQLPNGEMIRLPSVPSLEDYLTSYASRHRTATLQMLRTIVKDPRDKPLIRSAAVKPKRDWLTGRLQVALDADANLIAYRRKHSPPVEDAGSGDETTKNAPTSIPPPPVASATTPHPIDFDDLVREGKAAVTAETARKLRTIHREISQDIDDLEGILTREDQLPSRVKGAILGCAYYYHGAAVDADLRKKLAAFRKKYGSRRQSRLIDAR